MCLQSLVFDLNILVYLSAPCFFHTAQVCSYDRMGLGFSKRLMQNESTGTEKVWGMSTTGRLVYSLFTAHFKFKYLYQSCSAMKTL